MTTTDSTIRYMNTHAFNGAGFPIGDLFIHLVDDANEGDTRMLDVYTEREKVYQAALTASNKNKWETNPCDRCCPDSYIKEHGLTIESCRRCGRGRLMP